MINPADEFDAINFQNKNVNSLRILWAKFFKLDTYDNFKNFRTHCAVFLNGYYFFFRKNMRWPGIEPGSTAWKAAMLTIIPPTLLVLLNLNIFDGCYFTQLLLKYIC